MFLTTRRLAAFAAVTGALAVGSATAATGAPGGPPTPVISGPSCPEGYNGPTNLATGCPYYLMSYTVQFPGQPAYRCPPGWVPPHGLAASSPQDPAWTTPCPPA
jgi:hypothetical protein